MKPSLFKITWRHDSLAKCLMNASKWIEENSTYYEVDTVTVSRSSASREWWEVTIFYIE